jgi:hypothetical protein
MRNRGYVLVVAVALLVPGRVGAQTPTCPTGPPCEGGPVPGPLPVFPSTNWWNLDITTAPVDPLSASYIATLSNAAVRPDFGGTVTPGPPPSDQVYGMPYIIVAGSQTKRQVTFVEFPAESDGVGVPFYPIPDQAITTPHWIESGEPGNQNPGGDRHMLIIDTDNKLLYELYHTFYNQPLARWEAGSGAFFDMNTNNRRPEGWTSADAAGLAIFPGLVRYDEVYQAVPPIGHAFRVTVTRTNGHVFPASHDAGSTAGALPMGARLRLKPSVNVVSADPGVQRIVQALKTYGLIVADNGSNMFVSGTFDDRWDNGILNPALGQMHANDFDVIQLGFAPPPCPPPAISINDVSVPEGNAGTSPATFTVSLSAAITATCPSATVNYQTADGTARAGSDYVATSGSLTFAPGVTSLPVTVTINGDTVFEPNETFFVNLSGATNATIARGQGVGTILNDDAAPAIATVKDVLIGPTSSGTLGGAGAQVAYRYGVRSGRSYCVEVDNGRNDVSVRDTVVTVYRADGTTILGGSDDANDEPSATLLSRFCYVPTVTEANFANVTLGGSGTAGGFRFRVVETTLFCPWFFSGSGFEAFILVKNTTGAAHTATVTLSSPSGATVGSPRTGTAPANGSFNLQVSASPPTGFGLASANGGVIIAHDGPPGSLIANVTSLSFTSGVSFDTPAAPRQDPR